MSRHLSTLPWWFGQNLVGGYLVWNDNSMSVHKKAHWFAPRACPSDPELNQFWPICQAGEAVADTLASYFGSDDIVDCGDCADKVARHIRSYRFVNKTLARYCGLRLVQGGSEDA